MPLLDLHKLYSGLSWTWTGFLRDWDRSRRSANHPDTTRYNYLLAAAQFGRYLAEYSPDPDADAAAEDPCQVTRAHVEAFLGRMVDVYIRLWSSGAAWCLDRLMERKKHRRVCCWCSGPASPRRRSPRSWPWWPAVAFALCARPARPKPARPKQVRACRQVNAIAAALPARQVHMVADAWYAGADGADGADAPTRIELVGRWVWHPRSYRAARPRRGYPDALLHPRQCGP
jgi:hypothetical protein